MNIIRKPSSTLRCCDYSRIPPVGVTSKDKDSIRKLLFQETMNEIKGALPSNEFTYSKSSSRTLLIDDSPPPFDFSQVVGYIRPKRKDATMDIFESLELRKMDCSL